MRYLVVIFALCLSSAAQMPSADASGYFTGATGSGAHSWTHTVGNCSNRAMVVEVSAYPSGSAPPTSVTDNGTPMQLLQLGQYSFLYVLPNPPSGTNTIQTTFGSSVQQMGISQSWCGADQYRPVDVIYFASGSGANPSNSITPEPQPSLTSYCVADFYFWDNLVNPTSPTWSQSVVYTNSSIGAIASSTKCGVAPSVAQTDGWTASASSYSGFLVSVKPPAISGASLAPFSNPSVSALGHGDFLCINAARTLLYVTTDGANTLTIYNLPSLTVKGTLTDATNLPNPEGCALDSTGNYLFVVSHTEQKITTVNISNPASPSVASVYNASANLSVQTEGAVLSNANTGVLFVSDGGNSDIAALNVSTPTSLSYINSSPVLSRPSPDLNVGAQNAAGTILYQGYTAMGVTVNSTTSVTWNALGTASGTCSAVVMPIVVGAYVYYTCAGSTFQIETATLSNYTIVNTLNTGTYGPRVAYSDGNYLYTTGTGLSGDYEMSAYDIHSNPVVPKLVDTWWYFGWVSGSAVCDDLKVFSGVVYVGCAPPALMAVLPLSTAATSSILTPNTVRTPNTVVQ